jgi:hypothetical protein
VVDDLLAWVSHVGGVATAIRVDVCDVAFGRDVWVEVLDVLEGFVVCLEFLED